ncbi:glycosyltransferase family 2 protein [Photorhabdus heterorhabditis]|uniref:Glycosyltransferase n=1 Tax=Photorhabdus heterorhabditis TaxID=880156 RepID=A0A5B0X667_9GAMM|nr:glycosyltransferase family 2 protein [Photorhabdus heterorhabditis]KAA1194772.1 glycosyltransferase [Photorhabdus heterorhabditis]
MKISIITATYNSEKTLADTLLSLEKQTYQNIEYIIIDGASEDNTLMMINKNSTRVTTIISEPDKGIYDALNKGIATATGDIVGFLHSDDLFAYPEAIADIVAMFEKYKCEAVYGDLQYVSKNNINNVVRYWKSGPFYPKKMQYGWMPPHPTFYMKRKLYDKWGGFDLNFKISSDYDSVTRYIINHNVKLIYLPKVIIKMRIGGESNRLENTILRSKEIIRIMKNHRIFWPIALIYRNLSKLPQFLK